MATITNQATIQYNTTGSSTVLNAVSNITSTEVITTLALSKTPLSTAYTPGDTVSYSVYLTNNSGSELSNLTFSDDMGGSLTPLSYVDNSALAYVNGVLADVSVSANTVFSITDTVAAGATVILVYSARTSQTESQTITNTVTATAQNAAATLTESATSTITQSPFSYVNVYKQASQASVTQGSLLTYTLTLQNTGTAAAQNVVITDKLPDNFTVTAVAVTQGGTTVNYTASDYTIDTSTNTITLPTGSTKTISVPAATTSGPGISTVTITGSIA